MLRRLVFMSIGTLALLVVLEAPGQLHAQHMRGAIHSGSRMGMTPGFRGRMDPRFSRGFFNPRFDSRFGLGRFDRFEGRFGNRSPFGRFDRFEDRVENRLNRGLFFTPGFFPGSVFPF
jgi:hypothetical protein